jgi:hypothetical protein
MIGVISTLPAEVVNSSAANTVQAQRRNAKSFIEPIVHPALCYRLSSFFIVCEELIWQTMKDDEKRLRLDLG